MTIVILGMGSNIGDRLANLRAAVGALQERGVTVIATSSAWRTPPMPDDQPWYYNAVIVGETELEAEALLDVCKDVEFEFGRRPGRRWGPRTLDIDILFFGDERFQTDRLTIPHPGVVERGFVLAPLAEAWAGELPVLGRRAVDYLVEVDRTGLARIAALSRP